MNNRRRWISWLLTGILIIGSFGGICHGEEVEELEKEKKRLEERREEAQKELESLELEKNDVMSNIEKMDKKMEATNTRLEEVQGNLKKANEELEKQEKALAEAETTEANQYETMKKRIKYMYENGAEGYWDILFGAKSMGEFLNRVEYIGKIVTYDNTMLKQYEETKQDVEEKRNTAEKKKEQLAVLEEEVEVEQDALQKLLDKKEEELNQYTESIESKNSEMDKYTQEIEKKEKELEKLLLEEAKKNGYDPLQGEAEGGKSSAGFIWPLAVKGRISSRFGKRKAPTAGASTYHKGLDIAAPTGTRIFAAKGGTVVVSKYSSSAGNYIMINHGNGLYTVYMHASKRYAKVGDKVSQGETIALVGSTGYSTGAHLHFGVIVNGNYVDPQKYLP